MIFPVRHHQSPGFTLLEIMLVLLLTGLILSTVIPTLAPDSLSGQVNTLAEQLLATARQQQQQAMLSGQDRGLKLFDDGYQFLQFRQGSWQPLGSEPQPLPGGVRLKLEPGESLWQEMLWLEQQHGPRLESRAYQFEADDAGETPEGGQDGTEPPDKALTPDLVFRATSEISPAQLTITADGQKQVLVFEEQGQIRLAGEDDH